MSNFETLPHTIFERIPREHPNRKAVSFDGDHLTYEELNARANQLAYWLLDQGIKAECRVGVCLRPGFEIIIALLAIQKAGGVYLPIDPQYPKDRIQSIVEDAAIDLTLSQTDVIEHLGDVLVRPYTYRQTQSIATINRRDNPTVKTDAQDTAYIFYTSGTTGSPKGIAISYGSFAFYILAAIRQFGMTPEDRTLTIAKFSFSISLFDLMTSMASGGQLIILPRDEIMDYGRLSAALQQATVVHMGPNHLKGLVYYIKRHYPTYQPFSGLRHVSSGGDIVPVELLEELKIIFERAEIYIIYGCTEIACMGCFYGVPRETLVEPSSIGKPFVGSEVMLLSGDGKPAAAGAIGEICFSGPGIMKGYLNRPELTRNAFVRVGDATYFRTGDRGRINASGNVEFLGRRDFQIKLRGQRIELVEVERHLMQAPGVYSAVVTAAEIGVGDKRLIAYMTIENLSEFSIDAIRTYLQDQLPDYMQPSGWIILDSLPLNANFKIDRKALPAPTLASLIVTEPYVAPRNAIEQVLATILQKVLDLPQVGINDNFFHIGGDSLLAMNVCMLAAEQGVKVSPLQILENPTIEGLLEAGVQHYIKMEEGLANASIAGLLPELPPFIVRFLSARGSQTPHHWNISRMLVARRRLAFEWIEQAFRYLCERHDALRLQFDRQGAQWQASVSEPSLAIFDCKMVDLSHLAQPKQVVAIVEAARGCQQQIHLTQGPIASMVLFELGEEQPQELFFVVHHLVMDVISWKVFWLEFEWVYRQMEAGSKITLPDVPVSFKAWTEGLRQYANSDVVAAHVQHWIRQNWSDVTVIPKDFPNEPGLNTNGSAQVVGFTLSRAETQALMRSGAHGLDIECILMTGLALALGRWQKSEGVYFDRLVHGRDMSLPELDLSRTVGCLVSYAPIVVRIDRQAPVGKVLQEVFEQMQQVGNSGTSLDLYRYLGADSALVRTLEALPRAEVLFNYRGKLDDVLEKSRLFDRAYGLANLDHHPEGLRQYPVAISMDVIHNSLEVRFVYSQNIHQRESIAALSAAVLEFLRLVVNRSLSSVQSP